MAITLPNGWAPRRDQMKLWSYLERGGKRAVECAHRRWGKDDVALHWTSMAMNDVGHKLAVGRVGTYWHMLPKANQARKAIWEAVNPRTGKRRIDEAFPPELRADMRETDMFIRAKSGSTWQVVGSDNFDSLVGSPPVGIVGSEWALSDPRAWSYLRPILDENGGWSLFISTPRGRNHFHRLLELAKSAPGWFGETLTAKMTPVFSPQRLQIIRGEMIAENGEDDGEALFAQEYLCSFDAPLVGAYYAKIIAALEAAERIRDDDPENPFYDPAYPVETAWDLGYSDDTAIWFFQIVAGEPRVLGFYKNHGQPPSHYAEILEQYRIRKGWKYWVNDPREAFHWVPWDAKPKTFASGGKSLIEIMWNDHELRMRDVPNLGVQDGIQATRKFLTRAWFVADECAEGIECLRNYRREYDEDRKVFKSTPFHDWTSHGADAARYMAIAAAQRLPLERRPGAPPPARFKDVAEATFDDLVDFNVRVRGQREERI